MSSGIDEFLDEMDRWKFKAHERLKKLTAAARQAFWARIGRKARALGLHVIEPVRQAKQGRIGTTDGLARLVAMRSFIHRTKTACAPTVPSTCRNILAW